MTHDVAQSTVRSIDPEWYDLAGADLTILGSRSVSSGTLFWPRRLRSPVDGGPLEDVVLATEGTIWSWTFVHVPWPGAVAPDAEQLGGYAVGLVDLDDDGPRVICVLVGDSSGWAVGARVRTVPLPFRITDEATEVILGFEAVAA